MIFKASWKKQKTTTLWQWWLFGLTAVLLCIIAWRQNTPAEASFPGANGQIAFQSNKDALFDELYAIDPDGTNRIRLITMGGVDGGAAYSPDGTKIAFHTNRDGNFELYVMDVDGNNQTRLTTNSSNEFNPAWSPNGMKIAFQTDRDGNSEIYVMDVTDDSDPERLTNNDQADVNAAWSPNGSLIAFERDLGGLDHEVFVMDANGGNQTNLTNSIGWDGSPDWSPDGTQIVFQSSRDGEFQIYRMQLDGTLQTRLTSNDDADTNPVWSPDGTLIAFDTNRDGNQEIYVMDANGSNQTNVTNEPKNDVQPSWGPVIQTEPDILLYLSAETSGTTSSGVSFGAEDILQWDGGNWSLFFDGNGAGLVNDMHDINGIHANAADDIYLSLFQNKVQVPGLGNVFGHDIFHFDGTDFGFIFDGSDVGLGTTSEKLDALHVLDPGNALHGVDCVAYFLVSSLGTGSVPGLSFSGEDVLGFCATSIGETTAGSWAIILDGSAEDMPKNSTDSISASEDGETLYLTTQGIFNVDAAFGGHSMVYEYDTTTGEFSGPHFNAPANGLDKKVDGLHVAGNIP